MRVKYETRRPTVGSAVAAFDVVGLIGRRYRRAPL
jgi:hypothetical protein